MPRKALEELTESMFYVLMVFCRGPLCGVDAATAIARKTRGRVRLGPATLYTILAKFEKEGYLREVQLEGRKRTYCITEAGRAAYEAELERLQHCIADAQSPDTASQPLPTHAGGRLTAGLPAIGSPKEGVEG